MFVVLAAVAAAAAGWLVVMMVMSREQNVQGSGPLELGSRILSTTDRILRYTTAVVADWWFRLALARLVPGYMKSNKIIFDSLRERTNVPAYA